MLSRRAGQHQLSSLADQVSGLAEISTTLKTYLEVVVSNVSEQDVAKKLIRTEEERLAESKRMQEFSNHPWIGEITGMLKITNLEGARDVFSKARSIEELAELIEKLDPMKENAEGLIKVWRHDDYGVGPINDARRILGLDPISFRTSAPSSDSRKKKKLVQQKNAPDEK